MKHISILFTFLFLATTASPCRAKTLDVAVFCSPVSSASIFDFARVIGKARELSEKGVKLVCLNLDGFKGKDASWSKLWKHVPVDAALHPLGKAKTIDGFRFVSGDEAGPADSPGILLFAGSETDALRCARSAHAKVVFFASQIVRKQPVQIAGTTFIYVPSSGDGIVQLRLESAAASGSVTVSSRWSVS